MGIEATGKIHTIFETQHVSERFTKREFVVEMTDNPKYPQTVLFQTTGDRCELLDSFDVGDEVRVEFSLRGREWRNPQGETKYFNSLDVWKVELTKAARPAAPSSGGSSGGGQARHPNAPAGDVDDIPFLSCELAHEPSPIARLLR